MGKISECREKIDVMKGKVKLRERREWIVDDMTEKERRIEWWIRREAERNRRGGKKVRVGYMKMWIEGKLWVWDEIKEEMREWQGREVREDERGIERGKGVEKGKEFFLEGPGGRKKERKERIEEMKGTGKSGGIE